MYELLSYAFQFTSLLLYLTDVWSENLIIQNVKNAFPSDPKK